MTTQASPFGAQLRLWRRQRGLSQVTLAALVGSTGRHISFLETGRSRPTRQMVPRLADALDTGLREANQLLNAAGLPAAFPAEPLDGAGLAPYQTALDRLLAAHEPYPGIVLDRHWTVIAANPTCRAMFGPQVLGSNFVRDALTNPVAAQSVTNWPQVAWAGLDRIRAHQRRSPFDPELAHLVTLAETALAGVPRRDTADEEILICPWFRVGDQIIRTIAMVARFDHPAEITLDELRVQLMYPMDATAQRFFRTAPRSQPLQPRKARAPDPHFAARTAQQHRREKSPRGDVRIRVISSDREPTPNTGAL